MTKKEESGRYKVLGRAEETAQLDEGSEGYFEEDGEEEVEDRRQEGCHSEGISFYNDTDEVDVENEDADDDDDMDDEDKDDEYDQSSDPELSTAIASRSIILPISMRREDAGSQNSVEEMDSFTTSSAMKQGRLHSVPIKSEERDKLIASRCLKLMASGTSFQLLSTLVSLPKVLLS
ncbi:unnamed protein product [Protopolystoma xenopodis]|uniref:Uncharacterized protein n=1 Tax=Protopolystoma xenopodis TaxID=117903 RepID=A0A3S4ZK53_9PLAT|nr:unnamed protein product [Protopolystoma xenopodis]